MVNDGKRAFWHCVACVSYGRREESWQCDLARRRAPFCVAGAGNRAPQVNAPFRGRWDKSAVGARRCESMANARKPWIWDKLGV